MLVVGLARRRLRRQEWRRQLVRARRVGPVVAQPLLPAGDHLHVLGFELMSSAGGAIKRPSATCPRWCSSPGRDRRRLHVRELRHPGLAPAPGSHHRFRHVDAMKLLFDRCSEARAGCSTSSSSCCSSASSATWSRGPSAPTTHRRHRARQHGPGHVRAREQALQTPDYAFVLMGVIATALTVLNYVLRPNQRACSGALRAVVDRLPDPYLLMFPALSCCAGSSPTRRGPT